MKTYRCPLCASQQLITKDLQQSLDQDTVVLSPVLQIECQACHWVSPYEDVGGNH